MPRRPILVAGFRDLKGTFEVLGLGPVRPPFGNAQEVEVMVFLARRRSVGRLFDAGSFAMRWVGCGQLDLVAVGSIWIDGRRQKDDVVDGLQTRSVTLQKPYVPFGKELGDPAGGSPALPISDMPCFLVSFPLEKRIGYARVPKIELARALFGVSSTFLLEMMDGIRDGAIAVDRGLFDRARSGRISSSAVRIHASRHLRRREALMIAAYLTDDRVRAFCDATSQSLAVDPVYQDNRPAFIDGPFPFATATDWTFQGRWFDRGVDKEGKEASQRTFVITRILGIDFPLSFESVEVHVPQGTTTQGTEGMPPSNTRVRVGPQGTAWIGTGRAPARGRRVVDIASADVENSLSDAVSVMHVIPAPIPVPPPAFLRGEEKGEGEESTAGRDGSSTSGVRPIRIVRDGRREATEEEKRAIGLIDGASVTATLAALEAMADEVEEAEDWDLDVLNGPGRVGPSLVPAVVSERFRQMLIAEIETEWGFAVVADVGTIYGAPRSFALLVSSDRINCTPEDVRRIAGFAQANDGRWREREHPLSGFGIRPMHRLSGSRAEMASLAISIATNIRTALRGAVAKA